MRQKTLLQKPANMWEDNITAVDKITGVKDGQWTELRKEVSGLFTRKTVVSF